MADASKELDIIFNFRNQADGPSKAYHEGERQRIAKTLADARAAEKAKADAAKQSEKDKADSAKEAARIKREIDKQVNAEARELQRTLTRQTREANASQRALERETASDAKRSARDVARYKAVQAKQAADESHDAERAAIRKSNEILTLQHKRRLERIREQKAAQEDAAQSMSAFAGKLAAAASGLGALRVGRTYLDAISQGAMESTRELAAMAEEFLKLRDRGRELAGVMGKKGNNEFTKEQLQFGATTGQTGDEVRAFRTSFQGEAQQFKDRFAPGEYEKFEREVARVQVKEGLEAGVAGQLGAASIRTLRIPKKGEKKLTATEALDPLRRGFATLQAGSGSNPILSQQLSEIIASGVGPEGLFKNMDQAAVAIRTQAQYNASDSGMHIRSIERGFNDLDDKELKKLGVTEDMDFFQKIEAVQKAYKASGSKNLAKFLTNSGFKDERMNRGLRTHINEGLGGGVVKKGFEDAAKIKPEDFARSTDEFFSDTEQSGSQRISEAKTKLKEAALVQDKVRIATLLEDAKRQHLKHSTSTESKVGGYLRRGLGYGFVFGAAGYESESQMAQYDVARQLQERRAREAGVNFTPQSERTASGGFPLFNPPEIKSVEAYLAKLLVMTEEANKDRKNIAQKPKPLNPGAPNQPRARP